MKKYIVLIILFVLCFITIAYLKQHFFNNKIVNISSVNETYNEIPANLRSKYKAEIEQIINEEVPNVIKNVNKSVNDAKNIHDKILKNGYNEDDFLNLNLISEVELIGTDLQLYSKLMQITQEKYLKIKYQPIPTDNSNPLYDYLYPYFQNNNIDTSKLEELNIYINKQQAKIVQNYIEDIYKYKKQ
jgi:hypothetical protein